MISSACRHGLNLERRDETDENCERCIGRARKGRQAAHKGDERRVGWNRAVSLASPARKVSTLGGAQGRTFSRALLESFPSEQVVQRINDDHIESAVALVRLPDLARKDIEHLSRLVHPRHGQPIQHRHGELFRRRFLALPTPVSLGFERPSELQQARDQHVPHDGEAPMRVKRPARIEPGSTSIRVEQQMQQDGIEREGRPARATRTGHLHDVAAVESAVEVVVERFERGREALVTVLALAIATLAQKLVPRRRDGAEVARDLLPEAVDSVRRKRTMRRDVGRKV